MKETIDFLLALPPRERETLSMAENLTYSVKNEAPRAPAESGTSSSSTQTIYLQGGALDAIPLLAERNLSPVVLSFAHGYNCGGGFEHAGGSQEEFIWRASSIFLSLWPHRRRDDGPGVLARGMWIGDYDSKLPRAEAWYPHTEYGGIYSPQVKLLRRLDLPRQPVVSLEDCAQAPSFAVLTVAAQDRNREPQFRPEGLVEKLRTTLYTACEKGHQSVILGAFGCGYFKNPPEVVAATIQDLLEKEFKDKFRVVILAIPDLGGPNRAAFEARFGSPILTRDLVAVLRRVEVEETSKKDAQTEAAGASSTRRSWWRPGFWPKGGGGKKP